MSSLEQFVCQKDDGSPSIKDLSPLSSCPSLKILYLGGNRELKDLSPLSACTALQILQINRCPLISLTPLSRLHDLQKLICSGIDPQASLLPLESCTGLKTLNCNEGVVDLGELRRRKPLLKIKSEVKFEVRSSAG